MSEQGWIGLALVVTALGVALLAIAGFMLGTVLSRVAAALEGLRPLTPQAARPQLRGTITMPEEARAQLRAPPTKSALKWHQ